MKFRPYQAPRKQPKLNDMLYPPGSRQPGNVWMGAVVMNVPQPSSGPAVSPTPTPTITATNTPTPSVTATITPTVTPTISVTPTLTPTNTPTPSTSPIPSGTTEANAYLTRVVQSGGTLNSTISAATRTLFTSLVSNNLYDKLYAFYPHLGGVSASHSINAKSTSHTITFNGGWTFDLTDGSKPNGTNAYGDTGIRPSNFGSLNSTSVGALLTTLHTSGGMSDIGVMDVSNSSRYYFAPYFQSASPQGPRVQINANTPVPQSTTSTNVVGTYMISRTGSTQFEYYADGVFSEAFSITSVNVGSNYNFVIAAENEGNLIKFYSSRGHGFTFFASGLSGAEASTLTTIIKTWANAISRTN